MSKDICKKNTRDPILKATVTCIDTGVTTIIDTQNKIFEAVVAVSSVKHKEQLSEQSPCTGF